MMLRFVIALLRRVLGWMITAVVLMIFGRGTRSRRVLRMVRLLRRVIRI